MPIQEFFQNVFLWRLGVAKLNTYAELALQLEQTHPISAKKYEKRANELSVQLYYDFLYYRDTFGIDIRTIAIQ